MAKTKDPAVSFWFVISKSYAVVVACCSNVWLCFCKMIPSFAVLDLVCCNNDIREAFSSSRGYDWEQEAFVHI